MARLANRSLGASAVAVYLKSEAGCWRRGFATEGFPAEGPGEQAFVHDKGTTFRVNIPRADALGPE